MKKKKTKYIIVEVTTLQFLSNAIEKISKRFFSSHYLCIIISKLANNIIKAAIESFTNTNDDME